jgi:hypothetical protein
MAKTENKNRGKEAEQITIIDDDIALLVAELQGARESMKNLKKSEDSLKEQIDAKLGDILEVGAIVIGTELYGPMYRVSMVAGASSNIKREKLLERGVGPDIIDYATNRTEYTSIRIYHIG